MLALLTFEVDSMELLRRRSGENHETSSFISCNEQREMDLDHKKFRYTAKEAEYVSRLLKPLSQQLIKAHLVGAAENFARIEDFIGSLWPILRPIDDYEGQEGREDPFVKVTLKDFFRQKEQGHLSKITAEEFNELRGYELILRSAPAGSLKHDPDIFAVAAKRSHLLENLKRWQYVESKANFLWAVTSMAYPEPKKSVFRRIFNAVKEKFNYPIVVGPEELDYLSDQSEFYRGLRELLEPCETHDLVDGYANTFINEGRKRRAQQLVAGVYDLVRRGKNSPLFVHDQSSDPDDQ